jgi:hypothetical protein
MAASAWVPAAINAGVGLQSFVLAHKMTRVQNYCFENSVGFL